MRIGQGVDLVEPGDVVRPLELARLVVDQRVVVAQCSGVAFAAALGRAEDVVEVGRVVPRLDEPRRVVPADGRVGALIVRRRKLARA